MTQTKHICRYRKLQGTWPRAQEPAPESSRAPRAYDHCCRLKRSDWIFTAKKAGSLEKSPGLCAPIGGCSDGPAPALAAPAPCRRVAVSLLAAHHEAPPSIHHQHELSVHTFNNIRTGFSRDVPIGLQLSIWLRSWTDMARWGHCRTYSIQIY